MYIVIVITLYISDAGFHGLRPFFFVKFWKLLGGFKINAYICTAKMLMRYDDAAAVRLFLYLPLCINRTHWDSSVG